MHNFTPISSLIGGLIIGSSVVLFFYTTGRLAGISGIFANSLTNSNKRISNILFLSGLVIGSLSYYYFTNIPIEFEITSSYTLIVIAGFLVGFGTKIASGCTSGHGICGISRFSIRSIVATLTFIFSAVITVFILQNFGFYI